MQNVPQNHLPDLDLAREIVKQGDTETVEMLFGSVSNTLSELIRTAFIPKDGCRFIVADFSAIEARVLAWLAGEEWVLEEFRDAGKIYEETASRMYHIPKESIVKGNPNYEYRQKGKQATLSCGYAGGVGALKAMGAKMSEEEMQPLVDAWRAANPHIVAFWGVMERAARSVIRKQNSARVGKVRLFWKEDKLFMRLPSDRDLCYQSPHFTENRFGNDVIGYYAPSAAGKMVEQGTFGGKIVENCLAEGTLILTNHGLVPIENITASHLIWDGEAFVTHEGLLAKGKQMTICIDGVWMTPDHKILTEKGMVACGQSEGLNWAPVQLPDGFEERGEQQTRQTDVEVQMRLWKRDCDSGMLSRPQRQKVSSAFMWLYEKSAAQQSTHNAWDESSPGICSVAFYEPTVRRSQPSSISQLRWAWNQSVRRMAAQFRSLLERYGADVQEGFGTGSDGQRWGLLRGKLSLGGTKNQCPEPQSNENNQHTLWQNVRGGIVRTNGYRGNNDTVSIGSQVADRISVYKTQSSKSVYDIRNCGPRHRFTVWANGRARVVSNCTQAIARDLLAYAMQNLEHHGYHIVIHIHDEAVMEVPLDFGSVEEACTIMGQGPAWAEGLPLRADGYECSSYRKM